jgi:hypothetical protein
MLPAKRDNGGADKGAFGRALARFRKTYEVKPGDAGRARERFPARLEQRRRSARIGMIIDATASRYRTWERAQVIQARMFRETAKLSVLSLRLVHFGGTELRDHGWMTDPRAVAARMAGVRCEGGSTQIVPALHLFAAEAEDSRAGALILIGDCFEESAEGAYEAARALRRAGIRVFSFLEGDDWTAESVFRRLAVETGGAFARFGESLPLGALCEGVALLAAGGEKAVKRLPNAKVRQLLLTGPPAK